MVYSRILLLPETKNMSENSQNTVSDTTGLKMQSLVNLLVYDFQIHRHFTGNSLQSNQVLIFKRTVFEYQ